MRIVLVAVWCAFAVGSSWTAAAQSTPPREVATLIASRAFKNAAATLKTDHERVVAETVQLTEIPAPPFKEATRARAYAELMRASGLKDVTLDGIGNVIGVRPGIDRNLPPL